MNNKRILDNLKEPKFHICKFCDLLTGKLTTALREIGKTAARNTNELNCLEAMFVDLRSEGNSLAQASPGKRTKEYCVTEKLHFSPFSSSGQTCQIDFILVQRKLLGWFCQASVP